MSDAIIVSGIALLSGFILGILASIAAGVRLSFLQFRSSIAGYRVQMVANATRELLGSPADTGYLTNKYRYSLGVLLDELTQKFGKSGFL